ncbi:hypothetical protein H7J07_05180 [Mycobacterium koreense]|uniref:Uncharacterized protein n=1 Tax=Mycolicibacillus koreensis TaxID=1069220 RepID=A0A7I7SD92_9MYCO|nr:hypothetical protein [Mycolicibacillus koreensis]MCV7247617.1 hypothetical protein [Mycolicibacillus koreensis]OSC32808.1 hypothetical protein B8W67_13725 [Mycolicibacillus koreensis]BBY53995.1 hypothetical protein MKOR_12460 [Mycolicibacillus koreensis]
MATISKTTFTFTVLHRSDDPPADLGVAIHEADHGNAVGLETSRETVAVPDAAVADELRALGNDGEFFGDSINGGR